MNEFQSLSINEKVLNIAGEYGERVDKSLIVMLDRQIHGSLVQELKGIDIKFVRIHFNTFKQSEYYVGPFDLKVRNPMLIFEKGA
ncbi:hypothetical protein EQV77_00845 [Halobacillus fulvus]|nr:hypothetical protein EQV77_00845 [Halobacillus fulvus]